MRPLKITAAVILACLIKRVIMQERIVIAVKLACLGLLAKNLNSSP